MAFSEPHRPIIQMGYVTDTTAQLIWSMPFLVPPVSSVFAYYWRDGQDGQSSILLEFTPVVLENLVPSSTYNIFLESGIERSTTLQFRTRDVLLCGPIDDGGDDDVPLSSMAIRYVLLHNRVEYFVCNLIFLFVINSPVAAIAPTCKVRILPPGQNTIKKIGQITLDETHKGKFRDDSAKANENARMDRSSTTSTSSSLPPE